MAKKLRNKGPATIDRHLAESLLGEPKAKKTTPNFYHKVYAIVEQIPHGKVTTYGAIAEVIGMKRSARMVGQALTALPECDIPAHRVINRIGALTGAIHFGGYERMRRLLSREGVQ